MLLLTCLALAPDDEVLAELLTLQVGMFCSCFCFWEVLGWLGGCVA